MSFFATRFSALAPVVAAQDVGNVVKNRFKLPVTGKFLPGKARSVLRPVREKSRDRAAFALARQLHRHAYAKDQNGSWSPVWTIRCSSACRNSWRPI
ncbi:MAG TPA: hypothetical protein VGB91_01190, partial [Rhizomicrobium sp.]